MGNLLLCVLFWCGVSQFYIIHLGYLAGINETVLLDRWIEAS